MLKWINQHKYEAHLLAFLLMILPPVAMYYVAQQGANGWIWALLGLVVAGNLLAVAVR